jgi:hypothetical protein
MRHFPFSKASLESVNIIANDKHFSLSHQNVIDGEEALVALSREDKHCKDFQKVLKTEMFESSLIFNSNLRERGLRCEMFQRSGAIKVYDLDDGGETMHMKHKSERL